MKRYLNEGTSSSANKKPKKDDELLKKIQKNRQATSESVIDFKFNKKRIKMLNKVEEVDEKKSAIAYWMARDQRVQGTNNFIDFLQFHICYNYFR
jgi:hypothetical protein